MKNAMLVMMYNGKTNLGGMFKYDFNDKITLEITKSAGKYEDSNVISRKVVFNELKLDEILNYLTKTMDDLYEPTLEVYTICDSGKNFILNILEALKLRCGVPFGEELQEKWNSIIKAISNSKYLYNSARNFKSIHEANARYRDIINTEKEDKSRGGIYGRIMHEDGHPFRAISMILDNVKKIDESASFKAHTVESFNKNLLDDTDIPEDLSSFRSICINAGGFISMTTVNGGKIVSSTKRSLESFLNAILSERYRKDIFVASAEDAVTLYRDFLQLYTGKEKYTEYSIIFTKFLGSILTVDISELFKDSKDKGWDDKILAQKILEKDDNADTHDKCIMLVTDKDEFSITTDENGVPEGNCDQTKIMDYFGIDKSKIFIASCIILSKDESVLKFKSSFFECLDNLTSFGIDKLYIDDSITASKDKGMREKLEFILNEVKALSPKVEIEYKV